MDVKRIGLFSLKFFLLFGALLVILNFTPDFLLELQAKAVQSILNLFSTAIVYGKTLLFNGISFEFVPECTGFTLIALLASLYYATGLKFNKNFWLYSLFLILFNIFRIVVTLLLSQIIFFDLVHVTFYFIDSFVVFFIWNHEYSRD